MNTRGLMCAVTVLLVWWALAAQEPAADTVSIQGKRVAVADLTRSDVQNMTYADLANLPLEALMAIADKLEMSVEDLLNMKLTVSSKTATTIREQPGIISVITGEDIRKSGARDLVDVLRTVPGIHFGLDEGGVNGIVMRGLWAAEGKVLLLIDGQMMNEMRYSGLPFDHRFPVDNIDRVEIIRGPGSSVYGGYGELGVINITTRSGAALNGIAAGGQIGIMPGPGSATVGRGEGSLSGGMQVRDLEFSLSGHVGDGHRSSRTYELLETEVLDTSTGTVSLVSADMADTLGLIPSANVDLGLRWKGLSARFLYEYYSTWAVDAEPYINKFYTWCGDVHYDWKLPGIALTLTPRYSFKMDRAWYTWGWAGNTDVIRDNAGVSAVWDPASWLSLTGGVEEDIDYITLLNNTLDTNINGPVAHEDTVLYTNGKTAITFFNTIGYLQGLLRFDRIKLNVTAGLRAEYHSHYGAAWAPRVALTQAFGPVHYKLLYNRAFRSPNIGSIEESVEGDIQPEATDVFEAELGWKINKNMFVTCNGFSTTIHDPIVYWASDTSSGYVNGDRIGSSGVEVEYAARWERATLKASYSFYSGAGMSHGEEVEQYHAGTPRGLYYAAPQHKGVLMGSFEPLKNWTVSPTLVVYSGAWGADHYVDLQDTVLRSVSGEVQPASVLLNLFTSYEWRMGLRVGLGVYDILDTGYPFVQAYDGVARAVPSSGTEVCLRLDYQFRLKR